MGSVTMQTDAVVNGLVLEAATGMNFPPVLSPVVTFPPLVNDYFLEPDMTGSLAVGAYRDVNIKSRSTVTLTTGEYFLRSLILEPDSVVVLDKAGGPITLYVANTFINRGTFQSTTGELDDFLVAYMGDADVSVEAPFDGVVTAPNARLTLATVGTDAYRGRFFGREIRVAPDTTVTHAPYLCSLTSNCSTGTCTPLSSCGDDAQNGLESDVDCGGPRCAACADGQTCNDDGDCLSASCDAGVCQSPPGVPVTAWVTVTSDSGSNYCATLSLRNDGSVPTSTWSASIDVGTASLTTLWNASYATSGGVVTVTPHTWHTTVQPGATDSYVGFCAQRPPGSTAMPAVIAASGTP